MSPPKRVDLAAALSDLAAPDNAQPISQAQTTDASGPARPGRRSRAAQSRAPAQPARPSARDLATPVRQSIARQALKADVPAELDLITRLRRRQLDTGELIRDQVAIAVDDFLRANGY